MGGADVIVCEAFAGNVALKMYEGVAATLVNLAPAAAAAFALGNALALTNGIGFTLGGVGLWPLLAGALLYSFFIR